MPHKSVKTKRRRLDPILLLVFVLLTGLALTLGRIIWQEPRAAGLGRLIDPEMQHSGVASRVTAVLLNFRGYDTMLEVLVLFLAVLGVWSMTKADFPETTGSTSPIQKSVVRLLTPLMCLVAGYLVWQGSAFAGGAFQGGAVLGGAGVLLLVAELPWLKNMPARPLRIGLILGPLTFIGIALWCLFTEGELLKYPANSASGLLLFIETACAVSIGLTLASLFVGGRPKDDVADEQLPEKYSQ